MGQSPDGRHVRSSLGSHRDVVIETGFHAIYDLADAIKNIEEYRFPVRWSQMTRDYFRATGNKLGSFSTLRADILHTSKRTALMAIRSGKNANRHGYSETAHAFLPGGRLLSRCRSCTPQLRGSIRRNPVLAML